jgi:very-short-patch-repair endonuclease
MAKKKGQGQKSKLEDRFYRFWKKRFPYLPAPIKQHKFHPIRQWRFDFSWPEVKIAVEIQGGTFMRRGGHNTGIGQVMDHEKSRAAVISGWRVLQFSTSDLRKHKIKNMGKRGGKKRKSNLNLVECVKITGNFVTREIIKEKLK